jgi:hypothetical protein
VDGAVATLPAVEVIVVVASSAAVGETPLIAAVASWAADAAGATVEAGVIAAGS